MSRIDLHTHTNHSDGTVTPTELVCLAAEAGLTAVAIVDHDTTSGLEEAHEARRAVGVEVIDGCEISARIETGSVHILGYGFDVSDPGLQDLLARVRAARTERNLAIVERLASMGMPLEYDEVVQHATGRVVARPHFARAMRERGYITELQEAYARYIGDHAPGYVAGNMPPPGAAIRSVKQAGGVTALAHPRQLKLEGRAAYAALLVRMRAAGLDGLEVDHPSHQPRHRKMFQSLAEELDLVPTGGSDFHGANKPHIALGEGDGTIDVPYETWERLRARRSGSAAR